jgi:hypothetical protein
LENLGIFKRQYLRNNLFKNKQDQQFAKYPRLTGQVSFWEGVETSVRNNWRVCQVGRHDYNFTFSRWPTKHKAVLTKTSTSEPPPSQNKHCSLLKNCLCPFSSSKFHSGTPLLRMSIRACQLVLAYTHVP